MRLTRDQVGEGGNGVLGIATLGFEGQHRPALGGQAQQVQDALPVGDDPLAVDPDFGLERGSQLHELIGGSQVEPEDVGNPGLATGDMEVLSHRN